MTLLYISSSQLTFAICCFGLGKKTVSISVLFTRMDVGVFPGMGNIFQTGHLWHVDDMHWMVVIWNRYSCLRYVYVLCTMVTFIYIWWKFINMCIYTSVIDVVNVHFRRIENELPNFGLNNYGVCNEPLLYFRLPVKYYWRWRLCKILYLNNQKERTLYTYQFLCNVSFPSDLSPLH